MKRLIIDCSKPIGHPERERFEVLPITDVAHPDYQKPKEERPK